MQASKRKAWQESETYKMGVAKATSDLERRYRKAIERAGTRHSKPEFVAKAKAYFAAKKAAK